MDRLTPAERSRNMSAIRSKGMKPELAVRRLVHRLGFRFRLHDKKLPGCPDLIFPSRRAAIFVNGCFWHQHNSRRCPIARVPKSNLQYWKRKLTGNVRRDHLNCQRLRRLGWRVLVVWECSVGDERRLAARIRSFLSPDGVSSAVSEPGA